VAQFLNKGASDWLSNVIKGSLTFEAEFNRVFDDDFVFEPFGGFWVALTGDFQQITRVNFSTR